MGCNEIIEYKQINKVGILWYNPQNACEKELDITGPGNAAGYFQTKYYLAIDESKWDIASQVYGDSLSLAELQNILLSSKLFKGVFGGTWATIEEEYDIKSFLNFIQQGQDFSNELPGIFTRRGITYREIKKHRKEFREKFKRLYIYNYQEKLIAAWINFLSREIFTMPFVLFNNEDMWTGYFSNKIYRHKSLYF